MKLRLHLLAAGLVAATIWACAREHAAPTDPSNAALSIHVTFPSITPTAISPGDEDRPETSSRRLVTTIQARATDLETGEIAAEESVELAPDDTRFRLELAVPPDRDYRVDIGASGTRETGGLSTEPGLLYSGFGLAYRVNTDEPTVVEITLENRVPFLTGQVVTDVISLRWTAVASAIGYQVRETINDESRELDFTDLQLEIPIPPHRDPAGGGETRSYRVRAKLPLNSSAYSEPYQLQLSGPTPPAAVTDLAAVDVGDVSLELRWTAPGDDEDVGQADHYDVRISTAPIDESNFTEAEPVPSIPSPQPAGSVESLFVTGLVPETEYYFALRTFDDVPLASELSNVLVVSTVNRTPPDPAPSLLVSNLTEESLDLEWTATGDDGSTGQATAYDLRQSLSPITEANFETATPISGLPDPGPLGTPASVSLSQLTPDTEYYFALRILDEAGNGSNLTTTSAHTLDLVPPAATTSLIATAISENEITLEWTAAGDNGKAGQAATYDIRFSTSPLDPGDFDQATPVATPPPAPAPAGSPESFTTAGFERETRYYLALRTLDEAENASAFSNVVEVVTLDLTAPSQIRDLVATPVSDHSVQLSWTAPGDDASTGTAARYELRYAEFTINPDNFDQATPAPTPDPAPAGSHESVEVSGLVEGRAYTFAVRALDNAGNPAPLSIVVSASPADVIPPSAVADLSVLDVGRDLIALQWTAPGDDGDLGQAASYDVRFATFPITEANVEDATPATGLPDPRPAGDLEQATVPGLAPATTYYLALRTKDEAGNVSALSNVVQATTGALPPATPTDLLATTASDQAIDLTWTDVATDEESYDVERGDPASQDFEIVATLPGPFAGSVDYRDDGLTERTEYKYRVRAHNSGGASGYSNEALARTAMSAPTGLVADPIGTTLVTLTWTFGTDPDGFRIERRTGNGAFGLLADIGGSARDFQDDQTAPLTDYTYRVQGYDSFGSSGFSNEASATTPDDDPLCQVVPSFLDFGIVEAGFVKSRSFTIENVGGGTLTGVVSAQCDGEWNITAGAGSYALGAGEI
ncbi:MAG: fibronectin type III domain-containing protein, partial [Candidatus Eisenbacteria bacterium]|nr:fibronectin type III domain-containing protein [Candidatus Eisenbacteria bacterium]